MKHFLLLAVIALTSFFASAQTTVSELLFQNPQLISGTAAADGAQYRFANVVTGIDAIVTINSRSSSSVTLANIDNSASGYNKCFQPELGISGTVAKNSSWWMEFSIGFYVNGSTTAQPTVTSFTASSIDMDGDGSTLSENAVVYNAASGSLYTPTTLTMATATGSMAGTQNYTFQGATATKSGIDITANDAMALYSFSNQNNVVIRIGAKTGNTTSSAAVRLNSIWFKSFSYKLIAQATLPVKLTSFEAQVQNQDAQLSWTTTDELNFSHFQVEASTDGTSFISIAKVNASAVAAYTYTDKNIPYTAIRYYRLKMVDQDGRYSYSPVRMVKPSRSANVTINAFPNPASGNINLLLPTAWQGQAVRIDLYTVNGILVQTLYRAKAGNVESLDLSKISKGNYIVIANNNSETVQQQIVKL